MELNVPKYFSDKKSNQIMKGEFVDLKNLLVDNGIVGNQTSKFISDPKEIFSKNLGVEFYTTFPSQKTILQLNIIVPYLLPLNQIWKKIYCGQEVMMV